MTKLLSLTAAAALALSLAACSAAPAASSTAATPAPAVEEPTPTPTLEDAVSEAGDALSAAGQIEVDEGLFDVTITLPADYAADITQDEIDQQIADGKVYSGQINADGSVTYTMSKAQHAAILDAISDTIRQTLDDMIGSDDYPNITAIEANDNFTKFTVTTTTKPGETAVSDSLSTLIYYTYGKMYGVMSGQLPDNIHVDFVNADTGKIVSTSDSKDLNS